MTDREPRAGASPLNESQQRRLAATCRYVDRQLSDIELTLAQSASGSPFAPYADDLSPAARGLLADYLHAIRQELLRALDRHGVGPAGPTLSAAHGIRTHLTFVNVAIEELKPGYMRGYGAVAPDAVNELNGLVEQLQAIVRRLDDLVAHAGHADLGRRLERLEQAGADTGVLQTLAAIIDARGLVEFRPALGIVLDRLEDLRFEVAVFGRVSSGKSSLLNRLLGTAALPVGVTPVTSVPTRIAYGRDPAVEVRFAGRRPERLALDQLGELVTEQHNPANTKRVTEVVVTLPAPLLEGGLVVVDTPGLGSLATAGAAETLAYLPRCDVGLVLIDAAAPLSAEDVGTLERLDQAGIPAHLLLSKADLLAPADLARVVAYVEEQLTRRLGRPVPVRPISVMDAHAHLLDEWTSTGLEPLVSEHRRLARASVHRKIGALRQAVTATLEARRARARGAGDHRSLDAPAIEEELRRAAARFEQARLALDAYRDLPERVASEALREAAREVVASNGAHPGADGFAAAVKAAVAACVSRHFEPVGHELLAVATAVTDALEHASRKLEVSETPGREDWAALVREMPRLDLESLAVPAEGRWAGALGEAVRARRLYGRLRARLGDSLGETLHAYALVVHAWADRILAQYRREFEAQADMCRVQLAGRAGTAGEGDADRLDADLRRLAGPDERRTREASI